MVNKADSKLAIQQRNSVNEKQWKERAKRHKRGLKETAQNSDGLLIFQDGVQTSIY